LREFYETEDQAYEEELKTFYKAKQKYEEFRRTYNEEEDQDEEEEEVRMKISCGFVTPYTEDKKQSEDTSEEEEANHLVKTEEVRDQPIGGQEEGDCLTGIDLLSVSEMRCPWGLWAMLLLNIQSLQKVKGLSSRLFPLGGRMISYINLATRGEIEISGQARRLGDNLVEDLVELVDVKLVHAPSWHRSD
jgi:hypothetical protein